ncbi:MAG TPA: hypothetical protein VFI29_19310 [Hanamia sp.]|nr:hypothetical protein [Hanamia sp.]
MAQKTEAKNMCNALEIFLNSKEVCYHFRKCNLDDSLLIILDLNNISEGCTIDHWRGLRAVILRKGPLVDSLQKFDAYFLLKNRCNYFVLMSEKEKKSVNSVYIRQGCSSLASGVKITMINRTFYLGKIKNDIW